MPRFPGVWAPNLGVPPLLTVTPTISRHPGIWPPPEPHVRALRKPLPIGLASWRQAIAP